MAQIAQQDHLFIDLPAPGDFPDAQKAKLIECYKAGTILDVVLRSPIGFFKCISAAYEDAGTTRTYAFIFRDATPKIITATETISA